LPGDDLLVDHLLVGEMQILYQTISPEVPDTHPFALSFLMLN
jgi:hypothetical protein